LIELEEALAGGARPPKTAILAYASYHDGRNALLRGNRKTWIPYVSRYPEFPKAWLDGDTLRYGLVKLEYTPWPLEEQSALVNFLEEKFNKLTVLTSGASGVSKAVIKRFADVCKQHGIDFVLANIAQSSRGSAMLAWAAAQGYRTVDISVDQHVA